MSRISLSFCINDQTPNTERFLGFFKSRWGIAPGDGTETVRFADGCTIYPWTHFLPKDGYATHHYAGSWLDPWFRKVWLKAGPYKLVRFKRRKEASGSVEPDPLPWEERIASFALSRRKRVWLVRNRPSPREVVHVAISCNDAYAFPAMVLVSSVLRHSSAPVVFHVFSTGLSGKNVAALKSLIPDDGRSGLDMHNGIAVDFPLSSHCSHISPDTYLRFMIPDILRNLDRIVYLDVDLLVRGDLAGLWRADIAGAAMGCVSEEQMDSNGYPQSIGMKPGARYFNAGVIVMDLAKLRAEGLPAQWMRLAEAKAFRFMDQDVLNVACEDKVAWLSILWNFNLHYYTVYKSLYKKAKIVHFTGPEKPWTNPAARRRCNRDWWKAASKLPKELRR